MDRLTALFATTTIALGVTSVWFAWQLSAERERAALSAERVAALESALDRVSGNTVSDAQSSTAVDPAPSATPAEPDSSQIALQRRDTEARLARFRLNEAKLLRDTQYRERWLTMRTLELRRTYTDLQRLVGLSDAKYADFLATMAQLELEQELRRWEAPQDRSLDLNARFTAARQQSMDAETARRQVLRDTLGESKYRQWIDHQRTAEGRQRLERWRTEFATAGLSLTPDQTQDLLPILVEHEQRIAALPTPNSVPVVRAHTTTAGAANALLEAERRIASEADINAWLGDAVTGILTPEQRELMTATGNYEIELRRAELELERLRLVEQQKP
jgi:hypothetical protein